MARQRPYSLSPVKLIVTVLVAVPLVLAAGYPHSWLVSLLIGFVSIGAGHLADAAYRRALRPVGPEVAERAREERGKDFFERLEQG
jgi:hypothetical protein